MYVGKNIMDRETREKYWKQVEESEGFDITLDLDLGLSLGAPIVPQRYRNTKFKFVENLSVTTALAAGYWCRNTFSAKDSDSDASFTFQALGFWGDRIIAFCRLKKTSTQGDEYPPYSNDDYKAPQ
ncbi:hypothetical protein R3W88_022290 [Solanum pinnatisectum]|uniref:Uncharacterized protein n=1 Tax=Solanum pinnatisectum TaxID=50273 RepID=A0AAV9LVQ5_9SOLN|nr:hypothetical protein R3W88_022290 [Solanum pinnatisectum]